jgi:hypothetical protein
MEARQKAVRAGNANAHTDGINTILDIAFRVN